MITPKLTRFNLLVFLICLAAAGAMSSAFRAPIVPVVIQLQKRPPAFVPKEFYIAGVIDERTDKTSIGTVVQPAAEPTKAEIKGGSEALKSYILNSLPADKSLRPLYVRLKTLSISEASASTGATQGSIKVSLEFGLMRDSDFVKLDEYSAQSTYQRKNGPGQQAEPLLGNAILNALTYVNKWVNLQADNNIALATDIRITFADHKEHVEDDTIYYDVNRPLTWADFHDRPRGSRYGAEVFASLGYNEDVKLVRGILHVKLDIKVYLPKSACWARPEAMTDAGLTHEQHHFDIVKLVGEHFKQNILGARPGVYSYDALINVAYFDALREIDKLQKQYDGETDHSQNTWAQQQWNNRIDKELQQLGVKPLSAQAAFK